VQKILTSRALGLTLAQDNATLASHGESTLGHRGNPRPTPLSSHGDVGEDGERKSFVNINRSALRSAAAPSQPTHPDESDSDAPLKKQSRKRKKQHHPSDNALAPTGSVGIRQLPFVTASKPVPQNQAFKQDTIPRQPQNSPIPNMQTNQSLDSPTSTSSSKGRPIRRNDPSRISTALPENDPPKGPHCHCKAASEDPTLLPCADCDNKYHPRCVGKGRYAKGTYCGDPQRYMLKDLELFVDQPFKCGDCHCGFFGSR